MYCMCVIFTALLPPVVNLFAVNKYINQIYQYYDILRQELVKRWKVFSALYISVTVRSFTSRSIQNPQGI